MRGAPGAMLERALGALWYMPPDGLAARVAGALLWPLCTLTRLVAARRRAAVRRIAPGTRPAVIVIGNLTVGGTGKTPATLATAHALAARGWHVGLICGGYRARHRHARMVAPHADPLIDGDEAVLLAAESALPVAAAQARGEALALLRSRHPEVEIVVSDDGLQHPGLERTLEVAVFDARGAGNQRLLPAGPLREPLAHAETLDAILLNGTDSPPRAIRSHPHPRSSSGSSSSSSSDSNSSSDSSSRSPARFRFDVRPRAFRALHGGETLGPAAFVARFATREVAALAGIGHPERFFAALRGLGLRFERHAPGDHARIDAGTLAGLAGEAIVMTAKDAVKCAQFADERCWVLETETLIDPAFINWIEERLRGYPTA